MFLIMILKLQPFVSVSRALQFVPVVYQCLSDVTCLSSVSSLLLCRKHVYLIAVDDVDASSDDDDLGQFL